jgi:hypothetical protein
MLQPFTCDHANKLPWSNDFLDEVLAMRLMINTYEQREEAKPFWSKKNELEAKYLSYYKTIVKLESELRSSFDLRTLGTSRYATDKILSSMQFISMLLTMLVAPIYVIKGCRTILTNALNPYIRDVGDVR